MSENRIPDSHRPDSRKRPAAASQRPNSQRRPAGASQRPDSQRRPAGASQRPDSQRRPANSQRRPDSHRQSAPKRRRKSKAFRYGLLIYIFVLLFIFAGVLTYMWISLSDYQKRIDDETAQKELTVAMQKAPQLCFEDFYSNMTEEDWVDAWYSNYPYLFNSEAVVKRFVKDNITSHEPSFYKAPTYTSDSPVYLLKAGETNTALFYLKGSDLDWSVDHIELLIAGDDSMSCEVPKDAYVYCNEVMIDGSFITEEGHITSVPSYKDQLINPIAYDKYTITGLLEEGEITLESGLEDYDIATDIKGEYCFTLKNDAGLEYRDRADKFIKSLLYYYKMGKVETASNMNSVLSYVASGSEASKVIKQSYDGVLWRFSYPNIKYETSISPVYVAADNCYFVDVEYTSSEDENKAESYRVYFLNLGDGFKIYNFALN